MSNEEEIVEKIIDALKTRVRDQMRLQLERNPSADRRRILETALKFERQKIDRNEFEAVRALLAQALEEVGNEIRASF